MFLQSLIVLVSNLIYDIQVHLGAYLAYIVSIIFS